MFLRHEPIMVRIVPKLCHKMKHTCRYSIIGYIYMYIYIYIYRGNIGVNGKWKLPFRVYMYDKVRGRLG